MFKKMRVMRKHLYIIAILSIVAVELSAQTYGKTYTPASRDYEASIQSQQAIQSHQIMSSGKTYNGTVYEPFSTTTPSEYNGMGNSSTTTEGGDSKRKARKDLIIGPEDPPGPSPVGDAVLPLLLCAAAFCGVITLRRKRQKS